MATGKGRRLAKGEGSCALLEEGESLSGVSRAQNPSAVDGVNGDP